MTERDAFRKTEKCLYDYKKNLACLEILRQDLKILQASTDVKAQNYDKPFSENLMPSDPVHSRLANIETIENKIKQLERYVLPIERLERDLSSSDVLENSSNKELLKILRLFYFGSNSLRLVLFELKLSCPTFFRKRKKLVKLAMSYLGLSF